MVHLELDTLVREAVDAFREGEMVEVKAPTPPPPASAGAAATGTAAESALETEKSLAGQQAPAAAGDQSSATARSQLSQPADGEGSAVSPSASRNARLTAPPGEELASGRPASSLNASELQGGRLTPFAQPEGPPHSPRPLIDINSKFSLYTLSFPS